MSDQSYYHVAAEADEVTLGRKIYHDALSDRRGFRPDQIGIDEADDVWLDIFEAIGKAAIENAN